MVGVVDGWKVVALRSAADTDAAAVRDALGECLAWTVDNPAADMCVLLIGRDGQTFVRAVVDSPVLAAGMLEVLKLNILAGE